MKKFKQITAIIGIILLVSLYLLTFISAFTASPHSKGLFMASLYSSMVIPIFIYATTLAYKLTRPKDAKDIDVK